MFESRGLLDKVLKMAIRSEIQTQQEVICLIRNLFCFSSLRPLLLERGLKEALDRSRDSVFPDVQKWCQEMEEALEQDRDLEVGCFKCIWTCWGGYHYNKRLHFSWDLLCIFK